MLDFDSWREILDTISKNRLRTLLTGFSVAWGIFMLIVLLGSGEGLRNGVAHQFRDDANNSLWIYPGQTSVPFQGLKPGRRLQFTDEDLAEVVEAVDGVEEYTARFYLDGNARVVHGNRKATYDFRAVHPGHAYLENTIMVAGRFLNDLDLQERRKVAAIGVLVADALFDGAPAIGKEIAINGIMFKVVGVFEDVGGQGEMEKVYVPITTAQRVFNGANRIHQFMVSTGTADLAETERMAEEVRRRLARRHDFDPRDPRAVRVNNLNDRYARFMSLMSGIRVFIWIVGIGTILAGVVGVSNIMMITVRERTKEFGVRKALGATPWSIVSLILREAVLITSLAGYVGLVLGVATLEAAAGRLQSDFFVNPAVDLQVAVAATALLVAAGTIAGMIPAVKAARIRPVVALRDE